MCVMCVCIAKLVGTNCSTAVNCCFCHVYVPHSSCVDQLCQCDEGYYSNRLKTACIPRNDALSTIY